MMVYSLRDLVSYEQRHNEANGEDNRDGHSENFSFNYGEEGETTDEADILAYSFTTNKKHAGHYYAYLRACLWCWQVMS